MSNKGGWILPEVIDPPTRCISINVPDDPAHVAAFWGALWELAHWSNWQRDDEHLGKDVAAVWKRQWLEAVNQDGCEGYDCIMDVRQNEENPCTLEKTLDGITWEPFANLKLCPPTLRRLGNNIQYSTDGIGWYTVPDGDYTPGYDDPGPGPRPPAPEGQDQCCLASANAENAVYLTYAALSPEWPIIPGLEAILGADIANLLHILIGPLYDAFQFGIQLLTAFIAGVIFDIGTYTEEIREELRVIICENITVTENVPSVDFEAVQTAVGSMGGGVWAGINTILTMIGPSGLDLAASTTAIVEADCGDCGCPGETWCTWWLLPPSGVADGWTLTHGAVSDGYWIATPHGSAPFWYVLARGTFDFGSNECTLIRIDWGNIGGTNSMLFIDDVLISNLGAMGPSIKDYVVSLTGSHVIDMYIDGPPGFNGVIGQFYLSGEGSNPVGDNNCP